MLLTLYKEKIQAHDGDSLKIKGFRSWGLKKTDIPWGSVLGALVFHSKVAILKSLPTFIDPFADTFSFQ